MLQKLQKKEKKCQDLTNNFSFTPVANQTLGSCRKTSIINSLKTWDHELQREQGKSDQLIIIYFKNWETILREECSFYHGHFLPKGQELEEL